MNPHITWELQSPYGMIQSEYFSNIMNVLVTDRIEYEQLIMNIVLLDESLKFETRAAAASTRAVGNASW